MSLLLSFVLLFSYLLHRGYRIKFANRFPHAESPRKLRKLQYPRFHFFVSTFYSLFLSHPMFLQDVPNWKGKSGNTRGRPLLLCISSESILRIFKKCVYSEIHEAERRNRDKNAKCGKPSGESHLSRMRSKALSWDYISKSRIQDYNSVLQ